MKNSSSALAIIKTIVSLLVITATLFLTGCFDYHELSEQEQQEYGARATAYFKDYPSLLGDYVTEETRGALEMPEPLYALFENVYRSNDVYYGMHQGCTVKLKNGAHFYASYGLVQGGNLGEHTLTYLSEEIGCTENTLEATIAQMQAHAPQFLNEPWLDAVFDEFYTDGLDVRAEWMTVYQEAVQEISKNGFSDKLYSAYLFYRYEPILETENGNYEFRFRMEYNSAHAYWLYEYEIILHPVKH